jgi:hypothetical protein
MNLTLLHPNIWLQTKYQVKKDITTIGTQIYSYEDSTGASTFELSSNLLTTMEAGTFTVGYNWLTSPSAFAIAIKFAVGCFNSTRAKAVSDPARSCARIKL